MDFTELLGRRYYGNPLETWLIGLAVLVAGFSLLVVLRIIGLRRLKPLVGRTPNRIDDLVLLLIQRTRFFFLLLLALRAAATVVVLRPPLANVVHIATVVAAAIQVVLWGGALIDYWAAQYTARRSEADAQSATMIGAVGFLFRLALWSVVLLLMLQNLGFNVTALIAGLGIGGVAVALAVQNVLGDFLAAASILVDKPFLVGDFIVVGDIAGEVEHIGMKTTRLRSISGEQVIMSNSDLLQSRIRNFKRMIERRIVFTIGVVYQTPQETVARIPGIIREIVASHELARFDRSHFKTYGPSSLDFETVYFVRSADFSTYMDVQQAINLAILRRFTEEGIEFAYPTQTLFLQREADGAPSGGPGGSAFLQRSPDRRPQ